MGIFEGRVLSSAVSCSKPVDGLKLTDCGRFYTGVVQDSIQKCFDEWHWCSCHCAYCRSREVGQSGY